MSFPRSWRIIHAVTFLASFTWIGTSAATVKERAYSFNGPDGMGYRTGLTLDATGNFWGVSVFGGTYNYGDVFELTRGANGHLTETVLYNFTGGADGGNPADDNGPVLDSAGNLYGTTTVGGTYDGGTVFKLTHTATGWEEDVLWNFTAGSDGYMPEGGLVFDSAGNLYGTTWGGGPGGSGYGAVYELSPESNGTWKETTLLVFDDENGAGSYATLILDASGNIYGTTSAGGGTDCFFGAFYGCGLVFELTHTATGWKEEFLHQFKGIDGGAFPTGKLTFDSSGNLYGVAVREGDHTCRCGTVYRLSPPTQSGDPWTFTVLHGFTGGSDGSEPFENLILDQTGNVYGTASFGGIGSCLIGSFPGACGTVFALAPHDGSWSFEVLYSFIGKGDGGEPGSILFDGTNIYGTSGQGGYFGGECRYSNGCGTVFELTNVHTQYEQ